MSHFIKETSTNSANKQQLSDKCLVNDTLAYLGKRWLMAVLWEISIGHKQFSSILNQLAGISEHMLASRIRSLENEELITKLPITDTVPLQIHYSVTPKGYALLAIIDTLHQWTARWKDDRKNGKNSEDNRR
ncbi:helix-turn-helix domain-containing protein [Sphingobacterium oryzagri]|uniref:Helix-turn-helix domain-containing protein n=1 Tax=Sphingobacterium oryzagri TaxID=3025669 RepID=A0ABY7WLP7_9SPHI|nr:helix-turn-helix domain-containing protein [Sphingobacterium sp. KACC 22765]WDF70536.1 helix-turn-helix domain-containing protein [Sphingobacterium sp. KACC 22765]